MNTSYGLDTYRSHDLNIAMRTSSGDVIKLDFANEQSASLRYSQNENGSLASASFSSMQSFSFSMKTNGIDAQDQKEIDEFMKTAQPFIDNFLKELSEDAPGSPVTKLAHDIAGLFDPNRERDDDGKNAIKTNIVKMFDKALQDVKPPEEMSIENMMKKIFEDTQKLLEKTLKEFDDFNKDLYA
ncbi:putative ATP/GTP-binding protein [hydrothermal vent metagenome]|uniref:Putative ATP/GTP-binding protein n=1 Tax=hydrothermal vent metagenome TaxID=652676 RepID=A0A1W1BL09_9ZZZZ